MRIALGILMVCVCSVVAEPIKQPAFVRHDFTVVDHAKGVQRSGRLLVRLAPDEADPRTRSRALLTGLESTTPMPGLRSVLVPKGSTEEELADALFASGEIVWARPDLLHSPATIPDDAIFAQQYHHAPSALNTVGAWNMVRGDASIVIAVVDSGIDRTHPDLLEVLPGYNAIDRLTEAEGGDLSPITAHGTWVMGALGARGNNSIGLAGVGWGFSLLPIRTTNQSNGFALTSELVHSATWAADHGANIVNVSYEGVWAEAVGALGDELRQRGVLLVWAAGNSGAPFVINDWPGVTIVGATSQSNGPWSFTNYGPGVDLVAPGERIFTTSLDSGYAALSGTSLAAPLAAGVLGLVWSADPTLTADQVEQAVISTVRDLGGTGRDVTFGWGLVNAGEAVRSVFTGPVRLPVPFIEYFEDPIDDVAWPISQGVELSLAAREVPSGDYSARLEPGGQLVSSAFEAGSETGLSVQWFASATGRSSLALSYLDSSGLWRELSRTRDHAFESERFGWHTASVEPEAMHDGLVFRWEVATWSAPVFLDSIRVGPVLAIDPPWRETFDQRFGSPAITLDGAEVVSGVPSVSGGSVLRLVEGSTAESLQVLTLNKWGTNGVFDARVGAWVRPVDGFGTLVFEYRGFAGWTAIGSVAASQVNPGRMTRWDVPLPGLMLIPGDAQVRVRSQSGTWDLDDLFVTRGTPTAASDCQADLNLDGVADLADLTAFVSMYTSGSPGADLDEDGTVGTPDASLFVQWFLLGCDP